MEDLTASESNALALVTSQPELYWHLPHKLRRVLTENSDGKRLDDLDHAFNHKVGTSDGACHRHYCSKSAPCLMFAWRADYHQSAVTRQSHSASDPYNHLVGKLRRMIASPQGLPCICCRPAQVFRVDTVGLCTNPVTSAQARPVARGGAPAYSNVAIAKPGGGEWYAQLRMLFSCRTGQGDDEETHQLAFVRLYDDVGPAPYPFEDCRLLRWEVEPARPECPRDVYGYTPRWQAKRQQGKKRRKGTKSSSSAIIPLFEVCDIQHITRVVLVQPFGDPGAQEFVVNPWIRCSPPSKG
jgi:hypothetical protein